MSISLDPVDVVPAPVEASPEHHTSHYHDLPADLSVAVTRQRKADSADLEEDQLDDDDNHDDHDDVIGRGNTVKRDPSSITPSDLPSSPKTLALPRPPPSAQRVIHPTPPASTSPTPVLMPRQTENITPRAPERRATRLERTPAFKSKEKENARVQGDERPSSKDEKWEDGRDSVEYAYEYVPVVQRRKGRENISYELTVRQQPVHARTCGPGDNADRRPVNPAPIVQLKVMDGDGDETPSSTTPRDERKKLRRDSGPKGMMYMQNPYYFLFACLVGEDEEDDELHVIEDGKTRFLSGTPVSTLYHLKDLDGSDAAFFLFPDLGVRKEGKYKLKLTLFEIVDQQVHYCTTTFTQTFTVYTAKQFPGMTKTSELSTSFSDQGLRIWVRKEARRKTKKRKSSANDTDEEKARTTSSKRTRGSIPPVYSDRAQPSSRHQLPASSPFPPGYHPSAQPSQGPSEYYPGAPTHAPHAHAPPPSSHGHSAHAHGHRMPPPPPPHGAYDGYYGHGQSRPPSASGYAPHGPYVRPLPTLPSAPPSTYVRPLPILPPAPSSIYGQRSQHDAYGHAPQPHPAHTASYGPPPLASHESGPSREPSRHEAPNVVHPVQHGGHRDAPSYAPHDRDRDRDYPRYAEHPHTRGTPTSTAPTLVRRAPPRASESRPPASPYYGPAHSQHNPQSQIRAPYTSTPSHGYHAPPRSSGRPDPASHYDDPARPATGSSRSSARSPPLSLPPPPSRPDSRNEGHTAPVHGHDHPRAVSRGPAYSPRMADHRLDRGIDRTATPGSASTSTAYEQHYPPPYAHAPIRPTASRDGQTSVRLPGLADSIPPPLQNAGGGPPSRPGSGMTLPPLVTPQHRSAAPAGVPPGTPGTASSTRSIQSNQSGTSGRELGSRDGRDGRDVEVRDGRDGREGRGGRDETSNVRGQSVGAASTVSSATTPGGTKATNRMGLGHLMD